MASQIAQTIGHMPEQYAKGGKSTARILEQAGFPAARDRVRVDDVEEVFRREPYLVDLWLRRAHDQRYAGGWSIECTDDCYRVRRFGDKTVLTLRDRTRACAEFAARYVRFIGDMQARAH